MKRYKMPVKTRLQADTNQHSVATKLTQQIKDARINGFLHSNGNLGSMRAFIR